METSKTYNRTINLLDKYTKFIKSIDTEDIGNNLTLDKLIELKSILSDINNIMTLISTRSIATKLSDILSFKNEDRERIFNDIDKQKPNTNGFDIRIDSPGYVYMNAVTGTGATRTTFIFQTVIIIAYQIYLWTISYFSTSLSIYWTAEYLYVILLGGLSIIYLKCKNY